MRIRLVLILVLTGGLLAATAAATLPAHADPVEQPVDVGVHCVGDPPRQTFDPLSPPCVPFWNGDNGGATHAGVSGDEIRVLVTLEGGLNHVASSDQSNAVSPSGEIYDLAQDEAACRASAEDPDGCSHLTTRAMRVWQTYFNERFQSYGRFVHVYLAFASTNRSSAGRQADAAGHLTAVDPFVVVPFLDEGNLDDYTAPFVAADRLVFLDEGLLEEALLDAAADHMWDFAPSAERQATNFASMVCTQVVNRPAARTVVTPRAAAGAIFGGEDDRRLGLLSAFDPDHRNLIAVADLVRSQVEACGGEFAVEATHDNCCLALDNGELPLDAITAMRAFRDAGVTTVIWPGGFNSAYPQAARTIGYDPEWVLLDDGLTVNRAAAFYGAAADRFHERAVGVSHRVAMTGAGAICAQAFREIDPTFDSGDLAYVCANYHALHLLFTAIQQAGPTLDVTHVATGLHSTPPRGWSMVGHFGDGHSFLTDADLSRYDALGTTPEGQGCWRLIDDGARHAAGEWPDRDAFDGWRSDDPCERSGRPVRINLL